MTSHSTDAGWQVDQRCTNCDVARQLAPSLVAEVVSRRGETRDYVTKREEYLALGIPEYWIVDPRDRRVTEILRLNWLTDADVFGVRQRGREVAAALGLDRQDQVRVATALSEVGRELFTREETP